jgi:hypothetical protein
VKRSLLICAAAFCLLAAPASARAQTSAEIPGPPEMPRERISFGVVTNFALEGSGPWLAPGLRVTVPLGKRAAFDAESSAVFGGKTGFGSINSFMAANLRLFRGSRQGDGTGRSWIAGLRYYPITRQGAARSSDVALTLGHGWDQVFASGRRVAGEIGFSGGSGFLFFATIAVMFPLHR